MEPCRKLVIGASKGLAKASSATKFRGRKSVFVTIEAGPVYRR